MGGGRLTLDGDALQAAGWSETCPVEVASLLRAWVGAGGEITLRTTLDLAAASRAFARLGLCARVEQEPARAAGTVAPSAVVEEGAVVGQGTRVWRFTHVRSGAVVGPECNLGQGVYIDAGAVMGAGCKLQNGVNVYRGVVLGDAVFVGPAATFTNDRLPRAVGDWEVISTLVGTGASIGANATVVCGNHLGPHAMVGAGAVVTRPVPAHGLVVGVPARLAGFVCACGRRAHHRSGERWVCPECAAQKPLKT